MTESTLSPAAAEMLITFLQWEEVCIRQDVQAPRYWGTDGLGGARVSRPLARKGLLELGQCCSGRHGASLTSAGRDEAHRLRADRYCRCGPRLCVNTSTGTGCTGCTGDGHGGACPAPGHTCRTCGKTGTPS